MKNFRLFILTLAGLTGYQVLAQPCLFGPDRETIVGHYYRDLVIESENLNPTQSNLSKDETRILHKMDRDLSSIEGGFITFRAEQNGRSYIAVDSVDNGYLDIFDTETLDLVAQTDHGRMDFCKIPFADTKNLPFFYEMPNQDGDEFPDSPFGGNLLELSRMKRFNFELIEKVRVPADQWSPSEFYDLYQMTDKITHEQYKMKIDLKSENSVKGGQINFEGTFSMMIAGIGESGNFNYVNIWRN